jgi:predicted nucleic-acid-binding protein
MIGLDTNVLVRYLTQDDPAQSRQANRVIESSGTASLFVSAIVVCELVWVLETAYKLRKALIADTLEKMLQTGQFVFEDRELLWLVLEDYRAGKGDFADYLVGRSARNRGCEVTVTFDRGLKDCDLFNVM